MKAPTRPTALLCAKTRNIQAPSPSATLLLDVRPGSYVLRYRRLWLFQKHRPIQRHWATYQKLYIGILITHPEVSHPNSAAQQRRQKKSKKRTTQKRCHSTKRGSTSEPPKAPRPAQRISQRASGDSDPGWSQRRWIWSSLASVSPKHGRRGAPKILRTSSVLLLFSKFQTVFVDVFQTAWW